MSLTFASQSEAGGREENQDCVGFEQSHSAYLWLVCDGLGGHKGGALASQLAVEAAKRHFAHQPELSPANLEALVMGAHQVLRNRAESDSSLSSMRTTITALVIQHQTAYWAHIGDTRLYHFRNGALLEQTLDHSVPQMLAQSGQIRRDEIRGHEDRNRLLRCLGTPEVPKMSLSAGKQLQAGDAFLLCTDGFWELVTELEMEIDLSKAESPERWLWFMETRLARKAASLSDFDNYSATAVFI